MENPAPVWRTRLQIKFANKNAEIAIDQIRTIGKQRLKKKLDKLSDIKAAQLRKIITDMVNDQCNNRTEGDNMEKKTISLDEVLGVLREWKSECKNTYDVN